MRSENIRQRPDSQWTCVIFIRAPRSEFHTIDGFDDCRIASKCLTRPFLNDLRRCEVGIPCQPSKRVQIRERQRMPHPVRVHSHIRNADKSSRWAVRYSTQDEIIQELRFLEHPL